LVAVALAGGLQALPYLEYHRGPTVEQYVRDTLEPLPEGAVLVGDSDHRYFGFQYAQRVLGLRRDVTYVDIGIIGFDWHRRRIERRLGIESGADGGSLEVTFAAAPPTPVSLLASGGVTLREGTIETFEHSFDAGQNSVGELLTDDDGSLTGSSSTVDGGREKFPLSRWSLRFSMSLRFSIVVAAIE
jgi:hypothetical protein